MDAELLSQAIIDEGARHPKRKKKTLCDRQACDLRDS